MERTWTLNGRDNVALQVSYGEDGEHVARVQRDLALIRDELISLLAEKGVRYDLLRRALVPQTDRKEIALLFDSSVMGGWYGGEAAGEVLPLLDPSSSGSILLGDFLFDDQNVAFQALKEAARCWRNPSIGHTSQIYCVYLNNLTTARALHMLQGLRSSTGCFGFIDCTHMSLAKAIMSLCIGSHYVRLKRTLVTLHPDDEDESGNWNSPSWPAEEHGYTVRSIPSMPFDLFLSYKIERPVLRDFDTDGSFALAALSGCWDAVAECSLTVLPAKLKYLRTHKTDSLARAGLLTTTEQQLASTILGKIQQSYIYDLRVNDVGASLFSIMLELGSSGGPARLQASLEYQSEKRSLNLVTMF